MKRDAFEYTMTLTLFVISLIFMFLLYIMPEQDDRWVCGIIIFQALGIILTITSGIFDRGDKDEKDSKRKDNHSKM